MPGVPRPMLATAGELPVGPDWAFEFKWDGVRALAVIRPAGVRLYARSGAEITKAYPEHLALRSALLDAGITDAVLDGEMVLLDDEGKPSFMVLAQRMHVRDTGRARQLAESLPTDYMIFDVLAANGTDLSGVPYQERRDLLESIAPQLAESGRWTVPPRFADGQATLDAAKSLELEGVVAKRLASAYRPGTRSPDWIKIKHEQSGEFVIGGWRPGRRKLGALVVGTPESGGLRYRGAVGGGISAWTEQDLLSRLDTMKIVASPFVDPLPREDAKLVRFVRPELVVEVKYGNLTRDGKLRFPRFVRLRPDKTPEEAEDA